jgi:hypothetical protein
VSKASNGLYRAVHEEDSAHVAAETISLDLFHRRMGHIAPNIARKLVKNGFVTGVKLDDSPAQSTFCEACVYAKATRKPVAKVRQGERAADFAGDIHSNLWASSNRNAPRKALLRQFYR